MCDVSLAMSIVIGALFRNRLIAAASGAAR